MGYGLIDTLKKAYPVSQLCGVLGVHKSGYYDWQAHPKPTAARIHLQVQAKAIHAEVNQTYGSRRMSDALKEKGLDVGRYQARSLMQEAGVMTIYPRKCHRYPVGAVSHVADNHLNREFEASAPNPKWVGDITYVWTAIGWMYLAVVLDLFSRKVVGWHLSAAPDTALTPAALNQAMILRQVTVSTGVLFHSDQGCQYTSHAYQDRLAKLGFKASMSRQWQLLGQCGHGAVFQEPESRSDQP